GPSSSVERGRRRLPREHEALHMSPSGSQDSRKIVEKCNAVFIPLLDAELAKIIDFYASKEAELFSELHDVERDIRQFDTAWGANNMEMDEDAESPRSSVDGRLSPSSVDDEPAPRPVHRPIFRLLSDQNLAGRSPGTGSAGSHGSRSN